MATRKDKGKGKKPKPKRSRTAKIVERTEDLPPPRIPNVTVKPEEDEDGYGPDGLKRRWRDFVDAYVGPAGGNGGRAAELAGYPAENRNSLYATASRLLRNVKVAQAVAEASARKKLGPEWVQNRLAVFGGSDMNNFITVSENGEPKLDFLKATENGALAQVKEYDAERGRLKLYDPVPALTTLAKMFGLLNGENKDAQSERVIRFRPIIGGAVKPAEPAPAPPTNGDGNSQ